MAVLFHLQYVIKLHFLYMHFAGLHVAAAVTPEAITATMPNVHRTHLYLSDLSDGGEQRAYQVATRLQPQKKYTK